MLDNLNPKCPEGQKWLIPPLKKIIQGATSQQNVSIEKGNYALNF